TPPRHRTAGCGENERRSCAVWALLAPGRHLRPRVLNFASGHASMRSLRAGLTRRKPVPFMEANGISIHFDVAGHGPRVVLLHEMGGTLDSWDGIFPALSRRFRTLRYDQRGFGWSEKVRQPYTVETLVDDLEAVLVGAGLPPPYHFVTVAAA